MRIAILADIHANWAALQACLDHATRQRIDHFVLLGDLVGYGADPVACVEQAALLVERGQTVIRGNHEQAVVTGWCEGMHPAARDVAYWTREQLSREHLAFLRDLPHQALLGEAQMIHASPTQGNGWPYLVDARKAAHALAAARHPLTFVGHVHANRCFFAVRGHEAGKFIPTPGVPFPVERHRRWLIVAGAVGQPRDGNPSASYLVWDQTRQEVTLHRVPYDLQATIRRLAAVGLPLSLGERLRKGT